MTPSPNYAAIAGYCVIGATSILLFCVGCWKLAAWKRPDDVAPGADVSSSLPELAARRKNKNQG